MAQPYDLTGFASAQSTVNQMVADQRAGTVKFAGGSETWLPNPTGTFAAIVTVGGGLAPTTTNAVRALLTALRVTFDLINAVTGAAAANAITANSAAVPAPPLEAGARGAIGPVVYIGVAQGTSYDLSGIAALQATASAMLADQQAGLLRVDAGDNFELREDATVELREDGAEELRDGNIGGSFLAQLLSAGPIVPVTMADVRALYAQLRGAFDQLAQ